MYKSFLFVTLFFLAFLFIFSACSNNNAELQITDYTETLKADAMNRDFLTVWTKEIDPEILDKELLERMKNPGLSENGLSQEEADEALNKIEKMKNTSDKKKDKNILLPEGSYLSSFQNPVYPQIEDFEVLDLSDYSKEELVFLKNFITSIENKELDKNIFSEKNYFNYVILDYEISSWPQVKKYYIGKAYRGSISKSEEIFEIAIRLIFTFSYVDLTLNLDKIDDKCVISQVRISEFKDK